MNYCDRKVFDKPLSDYTGSLLQYETVIAKRLLRRPGHYFNLSILTRTPEKTKPFELQIWPPGAFLGQNLPVFQPIGWRNHNKIG